MKKKVICFILVLLTLLLGTACENNLEKTDKLNNDTKNTLINKDNRIIHDPTGNQINLPSSTKKIVSLAPSITETLIDLSLGKQIIAIDKNAKEIKGVRKDIICFDMMAPDIEKLINLKPNIIFASSLTSKDGKTDPFKELKKAGITVAIIPTANSIDQIIEHINFIAKATDKSIKGKEITKKLDIELSKIEVIGSKIKDKKTVYFEIAPVPNLYSFGKGVFLNEIIELIGAKNIFTDKKSWITVNNEAVVMKNPDVILTNVDYTKNAVKEIKLRKGWENMQAVKGNKVFHIDNNASSHPNEYILKAVKQIAKAIYPDKY